MGILIRSEFLVVVVYALYFLKEEYTWERCFPVYISDDRSADSLFAARVCFLGCFHQLAVCRSDALSRLGTWGWITVVLLIDYNNLFLITIGAWDFGRGCDCYVGVVMIDITFV